MIILPSKRLKLEKSLKAQTFIIIKQSKHGRKTDNISFSLKPAVLTTSA